MARNYLPYARVLAKSYRLHHPSARFVVLLTDDRQHEVGREDAFEVLHLDKLVPRTTQLHQLGAYYDVVELATAVKPLLLQHLLRQEAAAVVYLDPDISIYNELAPVRQAFEHAPIVLTPHTTTPYPRDGLRPTEAEILGAGVFNLGFIGVSSGAEPFLAWWWERLQREAVVDPSRMLFTDQRWIDFVPGLFPHALLKDVGCNVAYWNLHGRTLTRVGGHYLVNGRPLRFFHFSGYSPFASDILSKHTGDHPRVRLQDSPILADLASAYGKELELQGLARDRAPAYGWDSANDGLVLDRAVRRAYRDGVLASEAPGSAEAPPPDPYVPGGGHKLLAWLSAPSQRRPWADVNRYLQAVYDIRPDLQAAFPQQSPGANKRFVQWARHGSLGHEFQLADHVAAFTRRDVDSAAHLPVVHAVGYFRAELGVGEYGRQLVEVLRACGIELSTMTWTATVNRQEHVFSDTPLGDTADVNLLVMNADMTPPFAKVVGEGFFADRYTVGAWAWEVEDFPIEFQDAFKYVDEVWAISSFAREAIARRTNKPVHTVLPPLSAPVVDDSLDRAALGLPEGFIFLFMFDYQSVARRKNPLGLVRAFVEEFKPSEGPWLIIKSINGERQRTDQEALRRAVAGRPDVKLIEHYMSPSERAALIAHADCYVSLHRSEGLGLTMAEAMALGKPVIATAYSGNLDFMDEDTALLVPFDFVPVGEGAAPYPSTARWAEPRLAEAGKIMRDVWNNPEQASRIGARAAEHIQLHHSPAARASQVRERLAELPARRATKPNTPVMANSYTHTKAIERGWGRAKFLWHVARTPVLRRAAVRRRAGSLVSAGFGQSRRAQAEQAATREKLAAVQGRVDDSIQQIDALVNQARRFEARLDGQASAMERLQVDLEAEATRVVPLLEQVLGVLLPRGFTPQDLFSAVNARVDDLVQRLDHGDSGVTHLGVIMKEIARRLDDVELDVAWARDELKSSPFMSDPSALTIGLESGLDTALGYDSNEQTSYADFADLFRGSVSFIQSRQAIYLRYLSDKAPVVDIGCGRGEMLSVLKDAGVESLGVESDESMFERCLSAGLEVTLGDAVEFLREREPASVGAVTAIQVIEHLPLNGLEELLVTAQRALRPGGLLIAETVNPHSPRALKHFWLDLTHRHPIFPEAALMLARQAGFRRATIIFPYGSGKLSQDRLTEGEYAVLAWK